LRGAETNLERLDDVVAALEAQLHSLKKQARQATRYRTISESIRKTEAIVLHSRWLAVHEASAEARRILEEAEHKVVEINKRAAEIAAHQGIAAAVLPDLRREEAETAVALQRLIVTRENLDAEELRIETDRQHCQTRLEQSVADREREASLIADAESALERLRIERQRLQEMRQGEDSSQASAEAALAVTAAQVEKLDSELTELTEHAAGNEAKRTALGRTLDDLEQRKQRLESHAVEIACQRRLLEAETASVGVIESADAALTEARAELDKTAADVESAESLRAEATERTAAAISEMQAAEANLARLRAEDQALTEVLDAGKSDEWPPLVDTVSVEPGMEMALAAALGEDLSASVNENAPAHWRVLPPIPDAPSLPGGAKPLAEFIDGPEALGRRLRQVGVVGTDAEGEQLYPQLHQGQRLVSGDGDIWRWDGYVVSAGATTAAAVRLEQRNRLAGIRERLPEAEAALAAATTRAAALRNAANASIEAERTARVARQAADAKYQHARESHMEVQRRVAEQTTQLNALIGSQTSIEADLNEAVTRSALAAEELKSLPDVNVCREPIERLRTKLAEQRSLLMERQAALTSLTREAAARHFRIEKIDEEMASWQTRYETACRQIEVFRVRVTAIEQELQRLSAVPRTLAEKRQAVLNEIEAAETRRRGVADRLTEAETKSAEADRALRVAENALSQARESRVRAEGAFAQAEQACRDMAERIAERLDISPERLTEVSGLNPETATIDPEANERRLDRLRRERDLMGPVNLRAEQEVAELKEQIESMTSQRSELLEAIAKLRRGIGELDREGRARLLASFSEVDQHFKELFLRLFGGGRAHLTLTESDDPLEAGLEIMASPPGKRLQSLSLLSGGEQALTALALLFAVFLTNPAPICVLDEVDAPLDDANVDRFCSLLEEMANGGTRFLIITHHRMTMARMNRLFGVTMAERGVSQLVSVDLQHAEALRQTA
jgi:chromosome segregation protein